MNQTQRKFLIDKIEATTKAQIDALDSKKPERFDMSTWLLHYVLSDNFEIKSKEEIKETIRQKALKHSAGSSSSWMGGDRWSSRNKEITFASREIFIFPDELEDKIKERNAEIEKINQEIAEIRQKSNNLVLRIQLASNKTLETMVNEVDDMGNLSLVDTKLKAIGS